MHTLWIHRQYTHLLHDSSICFESLIWRIQRSEFLMIGSNTPALPSINTGALVLVRSHIKFCLQNMTIAKRCCFYWKLYLHWCLVMVALQTTILYGYITLKYILAEISKDMGLVTWMEDVTFYDQTQKCYIHKLNLFLGKENIWLIQIFRNPENSWFIKLLFCETNVV